MGFLKGLIFGGIVGGVATALLNPRTGQENQQMLKEMAKEITDEIELAQENLENFNTSKDEVLYHVENSLKPAIEGISQALKEFQFQAEPRMKEIEKQMDVVEGHFQA